MPVAVSFTEVTFTDTFWLPRLLTNVAVTIPYVVRRCEETGRIDNFVKAAGGMEGPHQGLHFDDSDVFKAIEGAANALAVRYDVDLDRRLDDLIDKIGAAQEADGYLYTLRTIHAGGIPAVAANTGKVAVSRGPLVYCAEGIDNGGSALHLTLADDDPLAASFDPDLLGGIVVIRRPTGTGRPPLTLIPYYAWSHRGAGQMAVWLRRG